MITLKETSYDEWEVQVNRSAKEERIGIWGKLELIYRFKTSSV